MGSAYKTAVNLAKGGNDVTVFTSRTEGSLEYEEYDNLRIFRLPAIFIPDPYNYTITPTLFSSLYKLIKEEDPDIFIVSKYYFFTSLSIIFLKLLGKKVVLSVDTFPGVIWFSRSWILNTVTWLYTWAIGRILFNLCDKVVLLHEGLISTAKKLGIPRFRVIHNGVDLDSFQNVKPPEDIVKKDGELFVTYIGRMDKVKGYDVLIEAGRSILGKYKNVKFLFVGGSSKLEELDKSTDTRMIFTGFRKDVASILSVSDIVVLPSFAEGLPNTIMEAMASKLSVIASNVGGIPYLIKDGETGFLIPPGDVHELEKKLSELIEDKDLRERIGEEARKKIQVDFNWEAIHEEYEKVFAEICG